MKLRELKSLIDAALASAPDADTDVVVRDATTLMTHEAVTFHHDPGKSRVVLLIDGRKLDLELLPIAQLWLNHYGHVAPTDLVVATQLGLARARA